MNKTNIFLHQLYGYRAKGFRFIHKNCNLLTLKNTKFLILTYFQFCEEVPDNDSD